MPMSHRTGRSLPVTVTSASRPSPGCVSPGSSSGGRAGCTPPGSTSGARARTPMSGLPQPRLGPYPVLPRPCGARTPHTPLRPMWCCRADGRPWPCADARLLLKAEFDEDPAALTIYLAGLYHEAAHDLYQLNPYDGPAPRELFERFVAWGPFRRPIIDPPPDAG